MILNNNDDNSNNNIENQLAYLRQCTFDVDQMPELEPLQPGVAFLIKASSDQTFYPQYGSICTL